MELYKDIIAAPHTLIAGTTGSGKSNVMNGIIREIMTTYTPQDVELYMIDPKVVELIDYNNTQYCKVFETDSENVPQVLDNLIAIMENRYQGMAEKRIKQYRGKKIYLIIDELADLMISPQNKVIKLKLQKILQKGRAAELHIIAATQAPNRDVIPANLVLNFTNRVALRCLSSIESRQIINQAGAELLPKHGKGLYLSPDGITTIQIPLTPSNDDIIARWEKPIEKPRVEKPIEYTAVVEPERYIERYTPQKNEKDYGIMFRNLGIALMASGLLIGMFA